MDFDLGMVMVPSLAQRVVWVVSWFSKSEMPYQFANFICLRQSVVKVSMLM